MRVTRTVGAFSLALSLAATTASADPIQVFSSFGPGSTFNSDHATFFGFDFGEEGDPDSRFARAMSFVPTTTAGLSSVELALEVPFSFSQGSLQINLFDSDGAIPGALLESWTGTSQTGQGIFRFDSALHPFLAVGHTYFLEATTVGQFDGLWFHAVGPPGIFTDVRRNNNGPWEVGTRSFETSFRVSGDASASATPEPASLLLLGTGLVLACRRRRAGSA
jgi:PEP-CTERM motif